LTKLNCRSQKESRNFQNLTAIMLDFCVVREVSKNVSVVVMWLSLLGRAVYYCGAAAVETNALSFFSSIHISARVQ